MKKRFPGLLLIAAALLACTACAAAPEPAVTETGTVQTEAAELLPPLEITVMNIGKADAILLRTPGHAVLIDTGEQEDFPKIQAVLEDRKVSAIDCLLLTHLDKDHIGGAADLLAAYPVELVIQSANDTDSTHYARYQDQCRALGIQPRKLREPLSLSYEDLELTFLPGREEHYKDDNDYSVLTEARYGAHRFLFAGDAVKTRLGEYLETDPLPVDFLKVPHHGRLEKNSSEFFSALSPQFAAITCSKKNPADPEVIQLLEDLGCRVCLTRDGPVILRSDGIHLTLSQP